MERARRRGGTPVSAENGRMRGGGARRHWAGTALRVAAGALLWVALFLLTDTFCWVQSVFGVPCPGCGSTRAAVALLHGRFAEALAWHPLIPLSLALLPYAAIRATIGKRKPMSRAEKRALVFATGLYLAVYAARMALFFPHTQPFVPNDSAIWRRLFRLVGM